MLCSRQQKWVRKFAPAIEAQCAEASVSNNLTRSEWVKFSKSPLDPAPRPPPPKKLRQMTNQQLREIDVSEQLNKLKGLQCQGRWLEWSQEMYLDLSWKKLIYNWSECELRFALQGMTDTAPTNPNLRRWGNPNVDPNCILCDRPATLRHVLNACPSALHQGRYTWRHDSVLTALKREITKFWEAATTKKAVFDTMACSKQPLIHFCPPGGKSGMKKVNQPRRMLRSQSLLLHAFDWEFLYDLYPKKLCFPVEIAATTQRPDIVIFSRSLKSVILIELTVPLEDRTAASHERKINRYASLQSDCEENGYSSHIFAIEIGSLGFVSSSLTHCLESLGFPRTKSREVRDVLSRVSLRCSYFIYLKRQSPLWGDERMLS